MFSGAGASGISGMDGRSRRLSELMKEVVTALKSLERTSSRLRNGEFFGISSRFSVQEIRRESFELRDVFFPGLEPVFVKGECSTQECEDSKPGDCQLLNDHLSAEAERVAETLYEFSINREESFLECNEDLMSFEDAFGPEERAYLRDLAKLNLPLPNDPKKSFVCSIVETTGPREIYLTRNCNEKSYQELEEALCAYCFQASNNPDLILDEDTVVDEVAISFKKGPSCGESAAKRVIVKRKALGIYSLFKIDHGTQMDLRGWILLPLTKQFASLPPAAIECHLPIGNRVPNKVENKIFVKKYKPKGQQVTVHVIFRKKPESSTLSGIPISIERFTTDMLR